jgi:hypothetical protein
VERIKPATVVVATFAGPKESRIGEKTDDFRDQQPFIAFMPAGAGKTVYLGSGEFWRRRSFRAGYHERFWIKLCRFAAGGAREQKKHGAWLIARNQPVGLINVEAQVRGSNFLPLPQDLRPTVLVRRVDKNADPKAPLQQFDMRAKPGDGEWKGYFQGKIDIKEPGEYEFQLPVPGTNDSLRQTILVRKANPELDNVRTNFGYLYQLASDAGPMLKNLSPEARRRVESALQVPQGAVGDKPSKRLFIPVESADAIADCLQAVQPKSETVRGRFEDLWDGPLAWPKASPDQPERKRDLEILFWTLVLTPLGLALLVGLVFLVFGSWQGLLGSLAIGTLIGLVPVGIRFLTGVYVELFWAVVLTPLIVGFIGMVILLVMRQWIAAPVFMFIGGVISVLALIYIYRPDPGVFVIGSILSLACLGGAVYMGVKKEFVGMAFMLFMWLGVGFASALIMNFAYDGAMELSTIIRDEWLPIGFSGLLMVAVSLLGVEWLARKLLRLA